jgi:hypothetical protein
VTSIDLELALVALGAMLSPTTLSFSILALVLGEQSSTSSPAPC